jgi:hypothetical protein
MYALPISIWYLTDDKFSLNGVDSLTAYVDNNMIYFYLDVYAEVTLYFSSDDYYNIKAYAATYVPTANLYYSSAVYSNANAQICIYL